MRRGVMIGLGLVAVVVILVVGRMVGWAWPEMDRLSAEEAQARDGVIKIVNQPVTHLPRTEEADQYSPGWFHPGATTPDFNTVDIRQTQTFPYANETYVTSDLNPNEMFFARELEFNSMTKAFYVDRSLPKRRLADSEMLEVNRLYRIIGHDQQARAKPRAVLGGAAILALLLVVAPFLFVRRTSEVSL